MRVEAHHFGQLGRCTACSRTLYVKRTTVDTALSTSEGGEGSLIEASEDGVPVEWQVGDVLLGLYEVTGVLGQGGMGKVYRVHHRRWGVDLAVKSPRPELLSRTRGIEHFERECETWVGLGLHPHIVTCYYVRRLGGIPRIFAEYVAGGSLYSAIRKRGLYRGEPMEALARILSMGVQVAWGLQHAHEQGVVHRDVKAGNVLFTREGLVKVTDFGLARATARAKMAEDGSGERVASAASRGMTPAYCSPEQAAGLNVGIGTDTWSWALCMVEALLGKVSWRTGPDAPKVFEQAVKSSSLHKNLPPLPVHLAELLRWCMQKEPRNRPEGMAAVARAAQDVYEDVVGQAFPHRAPGAIEGRAESLNNRAVSLLDLGKTAEAEAQLANALAIAPQHPESTYNLAVLHWRTGQATDDAVLRRMKDVHTHYPTDYLPRYLSARLQLERGDCESAISLLEQIESGGGEATGALALARERLSGSRRFVRQIEGHADCVRAVCFNRNGKYVLSASEDNTIKLWELASGKCLRTFVGHAGSVESVSLAPGGRLALSGSRDRTLKLWNVVEGTCDVTLEGHRAAVRASELSRDNRRAFSGSDDGVVMVWDIESREALHVLDEHKGRITAVGADRNGETLLSSGDDGTLRLWRVEKGYLLRTLEGHDGPVSAAWLSPCGGFAISGGADQILRLWDVQQGQSIRAFAGHVGGVTAVALSRDGRLIVSGSADRTVRVWEVRTGRCLRTFDGFPATVNSVAVSRDMRFFVTGGDDKVLRVFALDAEREPVLAPLILCRAIRSEAAVSDASWFNGVVEKARAALASGDVAQAVGSVREARKRPGYAHNSAAMAVWQQLYTKLPRTSLRGAWEGATFVGHEGSVEAVALSRDSAWVASGGSDGTVRLWESQSGSCLKTFEGHGGLVSSVSLTPDGRCVLSGSHDGTLRLWDIESGECARVFETGVGSVATSCVSPDGARAFSGGYELKVWDVASGRCLHQFEGDSTDVVSAVWSADGIQIFSGGSEDTARLWDVASGDCVAVLHGHRGAVTALALGAGNRMALTGTTSMLGRPGELRLWDLAAGECMRVFEGHVGAVSSVWLDMSGRFAASSGSDGAIRIWDLGSGECIRTFKGHDSPVRGVTMSMEGARMVSAGADGKLKVWVLDWELGEAPGVPWDSNADVHLESFLRMQTPLGADRLERKGRPTWNDNDFERLVYTLGCAGYGWLARDQIASRLGQLMGKRNWSLRSLFGR